MRYRGLAISSVIVFALAALSKQATAGGRTCLIGAGIDNVFVSAQGGCEWEAGKGFAMGVAGVAHNHLESHFRPTFGIDITATGVYNKRWTLGTAIGGGGRWVRPEIGGYADALVFFTGTMATAPYVETLILFYPHFFGRPNEDEILFRQRLGLKVKMGRSSGEIIAGVQLFFPDLSHASRTVDTGGFVLLQKAF